MRQEENGRENRLIRTFSERENRLIRTFSGRENRLIRTFSGRENRLIRTFSGRLTVSQPQSIIVGFCKQHRSR